MSMGLGQMLNEPVEMVVGRVRELVIVILISAFAAIGSHLVIGGETVRVGQPRLITRWAADVTATNAHVEYPRPQMVRREWVDLNGNWDYSIAHKGRTNLG